MDYFDIQIMITSSMNENFNIDSYGVKNLEKILKQASYRAREADQIKCEYNLMKFHTFLSSLNTLFTKLVHVQKDACLCL